MNFRDFESHFRIDALNLEACPKSMISIEAPQILVDQTFVLGKLAPRRRVTVAPDVPPLVTLSKPFAFRFQKAVLSHPYQFVPD